MKNEEQTKETIRKSNEIEVFGKHLRVFEKTVGNQLLNFIVKKRSSELVDKVNNIAKRLLS